MKQFQVIQAAGGPRELGYTHGKAAREAIHSYLHEVLYPSARMKTGRSPAECQDDAGHYVRSVEAAAPHLVAEIRGIAEGAGLTFLEAFVLQVRGEVTYPRVTEECSSIGVAPERSATGHALIAQNVDLPPEFEDYGVLLHLQTAAGLRIATWTLAGCVGQTGVNSLGVGRCGNGLLSHYTDGLPTNILVRMLLEQPDVPAQVALVERYARSKGGNLLLCDRAGRVINLETTPDEHREIPLENGLVWHTNHFRHPDFTARERFVEHVPDSVTRAQRLAAITDQSAGRKFSVDDLKQVLSDHEQYPASVCKHMGEGTRSKTVASVVVDSARAEIWAAMGSPCENPYVRIQA